MSEEEVELDENLVVTNEFSIKLFGECYGMIEFLNPEELKIN